MGNEATPATAQCILKTLQVTASFLTAAAENTF